MRSLHRRPEMVRAARISLERRIANGAARGGWPVAWCISLWARLGNGDGAHDALHNLLARSTSESFMNGGRVYQIDGNLGGAAGIAEKLLQSHEDEINILPALPAAWTEGQFKGLRARGAIEVDAAWS